MSNAGEFDITDNAVECISSRAQMKAHSEVGSELQWEGRQCPAQYAHSGACVLNKTQTREQKRSIEQKSAETRLYGFISAITRLKVLHMDQFTCLSAPRVNMVFGLSA